MDECIYGIDTKKKIKPEEVRDAIIECFFQAHKEILDQKDEFFVLKSKNELEVLKKAEAVNIIMNLFEETKGNFEKPTKNSLIKVVKALKKLAKKFRSPKIINKHTAEIMNLINKL